MHRQSLAAIVTLAGIVLGGSSSHAAFTSGTQAMTDLGAPVINGTSLTTSTLFTFGSQNTNSGPSLTTTGGETGSFMSTPSSGLVLSATSINTNSPTSFIFGNADFGMFAATSIMTTSSTDTARSFFVLGTFTPGTRFGTGNAVQSASFTVSFTQTGGPGTAISDSGTLAVPAAVPEPASMAMLGLGLVGVVGYARRRRSAA